MNLKAIGFFESSVLTSGQVVKSYNMNHKKVFHCSRTFYSPLRGHNSSVALVTTRNLRVGSNTSRDKTLLFSLITEQQSGKVSLLFGG